MPAADAHHSIATIVPGVRNHERADAGCVRLERQGHDVVHRPNMRFEFAGYTLGHIIFGNFRRFGGFPVDPLLEFTNTGEVLIELALICFTQFFSQRHGIFSDQVENALSI